MENNINPIIFSSTKNTRCLLNNNYKFIRSDVPYNITDKEILFLIKNKILTIIDLRTEIERKEKPCKLQYNNKFKYYCVPISSSIPLTTKEVYKSYIEMVDKKLMNLIKLIENSKNNVLFFCNAGKDRTGVLSAILLDRLGKDKNYIINDYLISYDNMKEFLKEYSLKNPNINLDVIIPKKEYIEKFLDWYYLNKNKL
jgi:protein tyrosine/serine phosphatase